MEILWSLTHLRGRWSIACRPQLSWTRQFILTTQHKPCRRLKMPSPSQVSDGDLLCMGKMKNHSAGNQVGLSSLCQLMVTSSIGTLARGRQFTPSRNPAGLLWTLWIMPMTVGYSLWPVPTLMYTFMTSWQRRESRNYMPEEAHFLVTQIESSLSNSTLRTLTSWSVEAGTAHFRSMISDSKTL